MSKKTTLKPIAAALGTTFVVSLAASPVANAADNPFSMNVFTSGYEVAEGNCGDKMEGEGKCGEEKKEEKEGKCGEGNCGENKETGKDKEGKCGEGKCGEKKEKKEGKCGEGKCGS